MAKANDVRAAVEALRTGASLADFSAYTLVFARAALGAEKMTAEQAQAAAVPQVPYTNPLHDALAKGQAAVIRLAGGPPAEPHK